MRGVLLVTLGAAFCAAPASADEVTYWNQVALNAVQATSTPPPRAARALAMVQAAVYDAVNAVDGTHQPYMPGVSPAPGASREAAAISAAHRVLTDLFPSQAAVLDAERAATLGAIPDSPAKTAGIALGGTCGDLMIALRAADGSGAGHSYVPLGTPGHWRIGPDNPNPPLLPQWGQVTPFAMANSAQFRGAAPPALDSAQYAASVNDVRAIGSATSATRTPQQTAIARSWAFGAGTITPPGVWNRIAQDIASDHNNTISENARMFAMLDVALADAAIACWDMKYTYDLWRPIHAIREADLDGNPGTDPDPAWLPLLTTPNFPSYTSGHSTFSRAAADILFAFFGTDAVDVTVPGDFGEIISFTSLDAAANEAGLSRIYGGIHYDFDDAIAQECGSQVADWVRDNYFRVPAPGAASVLAACLLLRRRRA